ESILDFTYEQHVGDGIPFFDSSVFERIEVAVARNREALNECILQSGEVSHNSPFGEPRPRRDPFAAPVYTPSRSGLGFVGYPVTRIPGVPSVAPLLRC